MTGSREVDFSSHWNHGRVSHFVNQFIATTAIKPIIAMPVKAMETSTATIDHVFMFSPFILN